jgi:hypothetical protein
VKAKVKHITIKRSVSTRWNSYVPVLQSTIRMRKPLEMLVDSVDPTDPIANCSFTDEQWEFFESLLAVLEVGLNSNHLSIVGQRCFCYRN